MPGLTPIQRMTGAEDSPAFPGRMTSALVLDFHLVQKGEDLEIQIGRLPRSAPPRPGGNLASISDAVNVNSCLSPTIIILLAGGFHLIRESRLVRASPFGCYNTVEGTATLPFIPIISA